MYHNDIVYCSVTCYQECKKMYLYTMAIVVTYLLCCPTHIITNDTFIFTLFLLVGIDSKC